LPIGEPEIIQNASYEVIRRFYKDWYRPELMSLFIVGNVDPVQMELQIKRQFGSMFNPSIARKKESNAVPDHVETFARTVTDPEATNANITIMYKHRM
jgi:zinc protease